VIPQILARIHNQSERTSKLIKQLLVEVGKLHPNAVMFSLYVAARSEHPERSQAAKDVLAKLHDLVPELVIETEIVSQELIRITLLFPEMWHDAIESAYRTYYEREDLDEMMHILHSMHERTRNSETLHECNFVQIFGKELHIAEQYLSQYSPTAPNHHNAGFIEQAWRSYGAINQYIKKHCLKDKILTLKHTAPTLLQCRDMHLAVPGTYDPDRELVRIDSFDPKFGIYNTQQRPREIYIRGSDGNEYKFVLKGREDLRQDERVMQLFGLINSLLARDIETAKRSLAIERFPVIPLSSNSGLIGFYNNCKSFTEIVRSYRERQNINFSEEHHILAHGFSNYESLTALQLIEAFEHVQSSTPGNDLQRAMWFESPNAETWLERRTNYTRSLAVMSIAGYILGLGDRHPANMLYHFSTGKVVHIDLGDCFEIAAHREKYPEMVPFRLTRMFVMPMEVSTIEGLFKFTANHTMRVLRANHNPLMAVLEAFVFDPLVSWSYLQNNNKLAQTQANTDRTPTMKQHAQFQRGPNGAHARTVHDNTNIIVGSRPDNQFSRSPKLRKDGIDDKGWQTENPRALAIVKRIHNKLVGTDFNPNKQLDVAEQIEMLIREAMLPDNLARMYQGWMPLW
ncbi:phosphatidylinositol kinase- protein kinase tor1, partial [Kickxella alabastrina]